MKVLPIPPSHCINRHTLPQDGVVAYTEVVTVVVDFTTGSLHHHRLGSPSAARALSDEEIAALRAAARLAFSRQARVFRHQTIAGIVGLVVAREGRMVCHGVDSGYFEDGAVGDCFRTVMRLGR